jgi:hypothetical protein
MTPNEHTEITRAVRQWITASATGPDRFDGISQLISDKLSATGAADLGRDSGPRASLAGWFQESTAWDLVLLQRGRPTLAVTYTSLMCNSHQDSIDDQADRVLGVAKDAQLAQMHGILPVNLCRAHVHLQELAPAGTGPEPTGQLSRTENAILRGADGFSRAATMCERMRDSGLYHLVWMFGVTRNPLGFTEPSPTLGWDRFAANLRSRPSP